MSPLARTATLVIVSAAIAGGCAPGALEGSIDSPASGPRVASIEKVRVERKRDDIPKVVECLSSNDVVVRESAIRCLQELTGETLDYRAEAPPFQRQKSIVRWVDWCRSNGFVPSQGPSE